MAYKCYMHVRVLVHISENKAAIVSVAIKAIARLSFCLEKGLFLNSITYLTLKVRWIYVREKKKSGKCATVEKSKSIRRAIKELVAHAQQGMEGRNESYSRDEAERIKGPQRRLESEAWRREKKTSHRTLSISTRVHSSCDESHYSNNCQDQKTQCRKVRTRNRRC